MVLKKEEKHNKLYYLNNYNDSNFILNIYIYTHYIYIYYY
jgi:hypothetical protein